MSKKNIDEFLSNIISYNVDDDFKIRILQSNIRDDYSIILGTMNLDVINETQALAALVGDIIARTGAIPENLAADSARAVILSSNRVDRQTLLLNLLHDMFSIDQLKTTMQLMLPPLPDIKPGWKTIRLENTPVNASLATWLKARNIISSWSMPTGIFEYSIRINLFRK